MKILDWLTVKLLKRLKPGYLPEDIFFEMCRLNTLISVEIIPVYKGKVCLTKRKDKFFGEVWHIPGTMVRGDETPDDAFYRLLKEEFNHVADRTKHFIFKFSYHEKTSRGNILHLVAFCDGKPTNGKWFNLNRLPSNTLYYHKKILKGLDLSEMHQ